MHYRAGQLEITDIFHLVPPQLLISSSGILMYRHTLCVLQLNFVVMCSPIIVQTMYSHTHAHYHSTNHVLTYTCTLS